jgi:hypothetical protein
MSDPDFLAAAPNIANGLFPSRLPPVFSGAALATWYADHRDAFDGATETSIAQPCTRFAPFNATRSNGHRRWLGIPSPIAHCRVAHEIEVASQELLPLLARSRYSDYYCPFANEFRDSDLTRSSIELQRRANSRATASFLVKTDIARFYNSIYTHAVAWVMHTRDVAKARRTDRTLAGNRIDVALRNCNDGQTSGIPIGPETSRIVAELLLSHVDSQLSERHGVTGIRFIDDYEITCGSADEAQRIIETLDSSLRELELDLNHQKTVILRLPQPFDDPPASEIKHLLPYGDADVITSVSGHQLRWVFERVFTLAAQHPGQGLLNLAATRMRHRRTELVNVNETPHA